MPVQGPPFSLGIEQRTEIDWFESNLCLQEVLCSSHICFSIKAATKTQSPETSKKLIMYHAASCGECLTSNPCLRSVLKVSKACPRVLVPDLVKLWRVSVLTSPPIQWYIRDMYFPQDYISSYFHPCFFISYILDFLVSVSLILAMYINSQCNRRNQMRHLND